MEVTICESYIEREETRLLKLSRLGFHNFLANSVRTAGPTE
jgi:hypothetical protein